MQSPSLHFLHIQAPPRCTGHLVAGRDVEAPVLVMAMAPEEPAGLGPFQIPEKGMRLQSVGGRSSGLCPAGLAPGSAAFPWGFFLSQALGRSYQRLAEIQQSYPHTLGQAMLTCQPNTGLEPQCWELGACSSPWACLPHHPVPPRPVREGRLALPDLTLARSPAPPLACTSGTLWICVPHPPASQATSCASSPGWPCLSLQLL